MGKQDIKYISLGPMSLGISDIIFERPANLDLEVMMRGISNEVYSILPIILIRNNGVSLKDLASALDDPFLPSSGNHPVYGAMDELINHIKDYLINTYNLNLYSRRPILPSIAPWEIGHIYLSDMIENYKKMVNKKK